ncbi:MAG: glycosyltransferase [Propionibacteriaceae bacterium]|jgi:glycosyltransferase involved in cell wall biosynthesis|nr:glycosyltransferase [Propionibacteriaceae bacterium]
MSHRRIQILLATYNGAAFVGQQLESLRAQTTASQIKVLVRDDGSSDETVALVAAFDPGPLEIRLSEGPHAGPAGSFLALLEAADPACDCVMLCDQDDYWEPDKAEIAAAALARLDPDQPGLYCCRSVVTDDHLRPVGLTDLVPLGPSFRNALVQIIASGHTMALNQSLVRLTCRTLQPEAAVMHDNWIYCLAAGLGQVVFDPTPHVRYRIHGQNKMGFNVGWRRALQRVGRLFSSDRRQLTRQAQALAQTIGTELRLSDRAILMGFLDQDRLANRLRYLVRHPLTFQRRSTGVVNTVLFALGRFRLRPAPVARPLTQTEAGR